MNFQDGYLSGEVAFYGGYGPYIPTNIKTYHIKRGKWKLRIHPNGFDAKCGGAYGGSGHIIHIRPCSKCSRWFPIINQQGGACRMFAMCEVCDPFI